MLRLQTTGPAPATVHSPADELDVIRLRTNYRKVEEVFLYRTRMDAETARAIFLTYVDYLNKLKDRPECVQRAHQKLHHGHRQANRRRHR